MRLYNTLTRKEEDFSPQDGKSVRMYVCGPTVYDELHIGNLRPIIVFDTLRKYMEAFKGWEVVYVQNITDVDDKLIDRANRTSDSIETLAERYTEAYFKLLAALSVKEPTYSPRATEHIDRMIELISTLLDKGHAYQSDGDVYYRVSSFEGYGKLSGRRIEELQAGARVSASERKDDPLDFTLWKAAKPGEPEWESPWGKGRPGWHTECVALARQYLGDTLDIHAGGNDLIFPHHENEIAQAEGAGEAPFARFWLHNGMLTFQGEKMSKSLGNFAYAVDVLSVHDARTVRYFYLTRHYRKPLAYSDNGLEEAGRALARVSTLVEDVEAELGSAHHKPGPEGEAFIERVRSFRKRYVEAMDDDLNTVAAISVIQELVADANRFRDTAKGADRSALLDALSLVRELSYPLGILEESRSEGTGVQDDLVRILIELRNELRENRQFALADSVRDRLAELGIILKDTVQGTIHSYKQG